MKTSILALLLFIGSASAQVVIRESGASGAPSVPDPQIFVDKTNLSVNQKSGLNINVQTTNTSGIIVTNGIAIYAYTPPDNGGDVSGLHVNQTGGGNAASFFHFSKDRPAGLTAYPSNGYAIEAAADGGASVILSQPGHGPAFRAFFGRTTDDTGGIGLMVQPSTDTHLERRAMQVVNAANSLERFFITMAGDVYTTGKVGLGVSPIFNLDIASSDPSIRAQATNAGGYSRLLLSTPTRDWRIVNDGADNDNLLIYDGNVGAIRMVFDTLGNVGIGDTSPLALLTVGNGDLFQVSSAGLVTAPRYNTSTNCADSAGAAACGSSAAGAVVIDASATTVVVSTTAVTANSRIFIQEDSSLGTELAITCNTTLGRTYAVTARTAATSFTITTSGAPVTNPACLVYSIIN